jgi:phosphatidylserine/phosphatidylglycerophosphate/cardiolipin synthase-like enzyme
MEDRTDLVLTVPESFGLDAGSTFLARSTLGVLVELLAEAQETILMGAPYADEPGALLSGPVGLALSSALQRGVMVQLMTSETTLSHELFTHLRSSYPSSFRVYGPASQKSGKHAYFPHAKFVIADRRSAYVGSANLTYSGIRGNLEVGVLVNGSIAHGMADFFSYLLERRYLVEVRW